MDLRKLTLAGIISSIFLVSNLFAGVTISFSNVDETAGTLDVLLENDEPVAGFQFDLGGVTITDAVAGDVVPADWMISASASTIIGFSLSGTTIPAGSGTLITVTFTDFTGEVCFAAPVFSDSDGVEIDATLGDCYGEVLQTCESDVCLTLENVDLESMTLDVMMESAVEVFGFQFEMTGVTLSGAEAGGMVPADWMISSSETTVLGFSLQGTPIEAGTGTLVSLSFSESDGDICLSAPVFSDGDGNSIDDLDTADCGAILGCTEMGSCNYNNSATEDDGSCWSADENCDCDDGEGALTDCLGYCDADTSNDPPVDANGDCEEEVIGGCTDATACNYDETATDNDGSCEYELDMCWDGLADTCADACADLPDMSTWNINFAFGSYTLSEDMMTGTVEILVTNNIPLGGFNFELSVDGMDAGVNVNSVSGEGGSADMYGYSLLATNNSVTGNSGSFIPGSSTPVETLLLTVDVDASYQVCFSDISGVSPINGEDIPIMEYLTTGDCVSTGLNYEGCIDGGACNYDPYSNVDDGSCLLPCATAGGCAEGDAAYDCDGNCLADNDGDMVCNEYDNCTDDPNTDQADTDGDGAGDACDECNGFDDNADADGDGVADGCDICEGSDDNQDSDGDGVPDGCEITGCMDATACNYDETATDDEGCEYDLGCGCGEPEPSECWNGELVCTGEECASLPISLSLSQSGNLLEISTVTDSAIAGFQIELTGVSIDTAYGGFSEAAGFTVSISENLVLGFSIQGFTIPAGSDGVLLYVEFTSTGDEVCITDASIFSDSNAEELPFEMEEDCIPYLAIFEDITPESFELYQNFPNPFNPVTNITFDVADFGDISLVVYDLAGKEIVTLISGVHTPGRYTINWDATDNSGDRVSSGMYIYKYQSSEGIIAKKMIFMK